MHVLVLDDDLEFLDLVARFLRRTSSVAEVLTASSISQAEQLARDHEVRVFVVDERVGNDSGLAFIESARPSHPGSRFLHFTSDERWELAAEALRRGADGVVKKSSWTELLIDAVRKVGHGEGFIDPGYMMEIIRSLRERPPDAVRACANLTRAEREVLEGLARDESNATIAKRRGVKKDTVKRQAKAAIEKLGAGNRREAVQIARRLGLV